MRWTVDLSSIWHFPLHIIYSVESYNRFLWLSIADGEKTSNICCEYHTLTEIFCWITQDTGKARIISRKIPPDLGHKGSWLLTLSEIGGFDIKDILGKMEGKSSFIWTCLVFESWNQFLSYNFILMKLLQMRQETINIYPHPLLEKVCSNVCVMRIISVVLVILDLIFSH